VIKAEGVKRVFVVRAVEEARENVEFPVTERVPPRTVLVLTVKLVVEAFVSVVCPVTFSVEEKLPVVAMSAP